MHTGKEALGLLSNPTITESPFLFELPSQKDLADWGTSQDLKKRLLNLPVVSCGVTVKSSTEADVKDMPDILLWEGINPVKSQIEKLIKKISKNPTASLALVQLLRMNLTGKDGIDAESLTYSALQSGPEFQSWLAAYKKKGAKSYKKPAVLVDRQDNQLHLKLNRPDKHNAFSAEMRDLLVEALELGHLDSSITKIYLGANGKSFCSGGDLDEFGTTPDPVTAHKIRTTQNVGWWIHRLKDKVKVSVQGACLGAGIELPAFAGHIQATSDAYFGLPEIELGLIPGAGGTVSIPQRIGRQKTAWLALIGETISAQTAQSWGLVDEVLDS